MTEKEFTYLVYYHLFDHYGGLPGSLGLFFGDGDGVFLRKYDQTENPCRKGEQKSSLGLQAVIAL